MNTAERGRWKDEVLELLLEAFASSEFLSQRLIFKGARVLNLYLPETGRQSLDIDSNLAAEFELEIPDPARRNEVIQAELARALAQFFGRQTTIRFQLENVRVEAKPPKGHPLGWNALEVLVNISDMSRSGVRNLPVLKIDIAAPEKLSGNSVVLRDTPSGSLMVYSLERIAGEKLRAYLTSLPSYNRKRVRIGDAIRVKDIYDIARILKARPLEQSEAFWRVAAFEFQMCCASRCVDCAGIESFRESVELARHNYSKDPTIPADISFDEAWASVEQIVQIFGTILPFPLVFEMPPKVWSQELLGTVDVDSDYDFKAQRTRKRG